MEDKDQKPAIEPRPEEPEWYECIELLDRLPSLKKEKRVEAIEKLVRNSSPGIRGRALRMGAALLSDDSLTAYLRNDEDDVLRNAGLEMLKLRGGRGFSLAVELLKDPDPDVSLQAVLVLDHLKDPRALEPLRVQLSHSDPNVVQAVIVAIGHLGDSRFIPDLLPFLAGDPWVQAAAVEALGDIRSAAAVPALAKLLTDLMVGPLAAEALARIGGSRAFKALEKHSLRFEEELDPESSLGLLAHVLEGLRRAPASSASFRDFLARSLEKGSSAEKGAAARCLLCLGPGPEEAAALDVLVQRQQEPRLLPACLGRRPDLASALLAEEDARRAWGFLLCARYPRKAPVEALAAALGKPMDADWLPLVVGPLTKIRDLRVSEALLNLFRDVAPASRTVLGLVLTAHRGNLSLLLKQRDDLSPVVRLVLRVGLGEKGKEIAEEIIELPRGARVEVLSHVADQPEVVRDLPWRRWLQKDPERFCPLAVEAAVEAGIRDLAPILRGLLSESPSPELIRAMGELGDRESVPILMDILETGYAGYGPMILESLGRIGGPEVREALRKAANGGDEELARIGFKALSLCAVEEDDAFFRLHASHSDWYVRLACAEVLGRFQRPDNLAVLAQLASDPTTIVAQRALAFLEPQGTAK